MSNQKPDESSQLLWDQSECSRDRWDSTITLWLRKTQLAGRRDKDGWKLGRVSSFRRRSSRVPDRTVNQNLGGESRVTAHLWNLGQHRKNCVCGAGHTGIWVYSWYWISQICLKEKNVGSAQESESSGLVPRTWVWECDLFPSPFCIGLARNDPGLGMG